ncbi:MAG: biopolymer transporter ExbD [Polyangiales bacterium]
MAGGVRAREGALKSDINVTPLVDVVLVLLIIFMVITPMLTRGRDVQLPVAKSSDAEAEMRESVVLTVTADKQLWVEADKVDAESLVGALKQKLSGHENMQVLIKADSTVSVAALRPVLQKLKSAHITEIAFAVLGEKE